MATDRELGTRIKRARERLHWRQVDLARAVSVNVKTVGNWERGHSIPRNRLGAIETTIGVTLTKEESQDSWYDKDDPIERALAEDPRLPEDDRRELIAWLRARRMRHTPQQQAPPG